jgi:hypothetical protein
LLTCLVVAFILIHKLITYLATCKNKIEAVFEDDYELLCWYLARKNPVSTALNGSTTSDIIGISRGFDSLFNLKA